MWSIIALIGLFCTLVLGGFTLLSLFTITRKGSLKNGGISLLLSAVFFTVFIFSVVKTEQTMQVSSNAENSNLKQTVRHSPAYHQPAQHRQTTSK